MSDGAKVIADLQDYARQLKRHTKGRFAMVFHLSALEKTYQQDWYRREVAAQLKPLKERYGASSFALPTHDLVVITKDAHLDDISPVFSAIVRTLSASGVIRSLDPEVGVSDPFTTWYRLESDYKAFMGFVTRLSAAPGMLGERRLAAGAEADSYVGPGLSEQADAGAVFQLRKPPAQQTNDNTRQLKMSRGVRSLPIAVPRAASATRDLDPHMLVELCTAISSTDLSRYIRRCPVKAMLANQPPSPVMTHWQLPMDPIISDLLGRTQLKPNRWFGRYIEDMLSSRLLALEPDMGDRDGLATSLRVTAQACLDSNFNEFHSSLGDISRHSVVLEFSVYDVMQGYGTYCAAHDRIRAGEYRTCVADLDIRLLPWMQFDKLKSHFLKVVMPEGDVSGWLDDETRLMLPMALHQAGLGRIILADANTKAQIDLGLDLGIRLFQGEAV